MKNDAGNVVSDADGMKNIWRKYIEKLLNVENDWENPVLLLQLYFLQSGEPLFIPFITLLQRGVALFLARRMDNL